MELFKIFGSLIIQDDDAIKLLNDAESKAKMTAKQVQTLGDNAVKMGKAVAVGAGVAVAGLFGIATKAAESTDRIDKMSAKLGLSISGFQEWDYILGQNGISIDSMQGGLKTLTNMYDDLGKGSKGATESFGRLGLSMDNLKGKTQEEVFAIVVEKLQGVTNESERAAIANDLLGRSGSELAPLLNAGAEATENLRQRAYDLGLVMGDDAVQAGVVFGDTMDDLKKSFGVVVAQVGVEVMPIFQKLMNWILENMPTIKDVVSKVLNGIADVIKWVSDNASWLVPILAGLLGAFIAFQVVSAIAGLFTMFAGVLTGASSAMAILNLVMLANPIGVVALAIGALIAIGVALWMNWDTVVEKAKGLWTSIKDIFGKIKDFVSDVWNTITSIIKLPTITIQGNLNPLTWLKNGIPKFNVNWNAEGGIFDRPTIFNTRAGLQGVGESGPEAIMPLSKLDDMLSNNGIDYDLLADKMVQAMSKVAIVLDKDEVGTFVDKRILKGAY